MPPSKLPSLTHSNPETQHLLKHHKTLYVHLSYHHPQMLNMLTRLRLTLLLPSTPHTTTVEPSPIQYAYLDILTLSHGPFEADRIVTPKMTTHFNRKFRTRYEHDVLMGWYGAYRGRMREEKKEGGGGVGEGESFRVKRVEGRLILHQ